LTFLVPRIRLYTTRWCGYCVRAKALLDARGLGYEEISLDESTAGGLLKAIQAVQADDPRQRHRKDD